MHKKCSLSGNISWQSHHIIFVNQEFCDDIEFATNSVNPCKSLAPLNCLQKMQFLLKLFPGVPLSLNILIHLDQFVSQLLVRLIGGQVQSESEDKVRYFSIWAQREPCWSIVTCWNKCEPLGSWLGYPISQLWTAGARWNRTAPRIMRGFHSKLKFGVNPSTSIWSQVQSEVNISI